MSEFLFYKNIKIHYTDVGSGKAIVLLHGFLENLSMWSDISKRLSGKNRVVCIDLLGHGSTESHGYIHTMDDQARMIKAVLNHIRLRKYSLVGHSMGGYVSLAFAKIYPENMRGLCLMNSTALPDSKEKKINRDRAIEAVKQNRKTFVRIAIPMLFSEKNRTIFTTEIKQLTQEALQISTQGILASLEGMKIRKNLTPLYKNSNYPIQLIIGKEDPVLEYSSLLDQTNNTKVQVVEFPDGHMSHVENKDALLQSLISFLKKCT